MSLLISYSSYQLQDFIPFSSDIYFRLLERIGETYWPLHLLTLAIGIAAVLLALKKHARLACLLIALAWGNVGYVFFMQHYAELNWMGNYIGYAFFAQATVLLLAGLTGAGLANVRHRTRPSVIIGMILAVAGLLGLPLIAPLSGASWYQAQVFGIYADPTALTTLGLVLIIFRGWLLWLSAIIPLLWLLVSGLTLWVLLAPGSMS